MQMKVSRTILKKVDDYKYLGSFISSSEKDFKFEQASQNSIFWSLRLQNLSKGFQIRYRTNTSLWFWDVITYNLIILIYYK